MFGHAGDAGEVDPGPEGDDKTLELDPYPGREVTGLQKEDAFFGIDAVNLTLEDLDVAAELADGVDDMSGPG